MKKVEEVKKKTGKRAWIVEIIESVSLWVCSFHAALDESDSDISPDDSSQLTNLCFLATLSEIIDSNNEDISRLQ